MQKQNLRVNLGCIDILVCKISESLARLQDGGLDLRGLEVAGKALASPPDLQQKQAVVPLSATQVPWCNWLLWVLPFVAQLD